MVREAFEQFCEQCNLVYLETVEPRFLSIHEASLWSSLVNVCSDR